MNKIIVEQKEIDLQDDKVIISKYLDKLVLNIKGNVLCKLEELNNKEIEINLLENSYLVLEFLGVLDNSLNKIKINNKENSKLDLHFAYFYKNTNKLILENIMNSSNNKNEILIRAVEDNGTIEVVASGVIDEFTKDNFYKEDIKVITNDYSKVIIKPDLLIRTNLVNASHNATISPVNQDECFYLESMGIDSFNAKKLIKEGFLKEAIKVNWGGE